MDKIEQFVTKAQKELSGASPQKILDFAYREFNNKLLISFSGAEDVILIDIAYKMNINPTVITLDTGRLFPETLQYLETVRTTYKINLEVLSPDKAELEAFVKEKGLFSFYTDGHKECCGIRKIKPLRKRLETEASWVTGIRKDQSVTRVAIQPVEIDYMFSTDTNRLVKFNPLAEWTSIEIWQYITNNQVPYNPLHKQGYMSLGCAPCTRATHPGQQEREGRWWWESADKKECGLHGKDN